MDEDAQPDAPRALRAEVFLASAILAMLLVIAVIALLLWREDNLHAQEEAVVARVRAARVELMAMTQAASDAGSIASRHMATQSQIHHDEYVRAKQEARARRTALTEITPNEAAVTAHIARLSTLMEEHFAWLDAEMTHGRTAAILDGQERRDAFREESAALFSWLNNRIDVARNAQEQARGHLNLLSGLLAFIALAASVLAIFALQRQREEWRLAHSAAEQARASAAASELSKTRFLAVASHDMRQPLHALMLYINALERRVQSDQARDILSKMDRATRAMTGMFSSLLDLARIQSGVIAPEIVNFPLQDVLDRIVAETPQGALAAPSSTSLLLHSDPDLLERALHHLLTNAVKHGGGKARIELAPTGDSVEITVADDGAGIAPADQERIFEEFARLEGQGEGLGVGLAIVKSIGERLNAPIKLQSAPGQGARFSMRIPLASADAAPHVVSSAHTLAGATALVVDDDQLAREAVAGALGDLSVTVRACANESEAQAALDEGVKPAFIVMDLRIEGQLRGVDVARRLRDKLTPQPAVIVVTGDTENETLAMLRASGFAWLIKPVEPRVLIEAAAAQLRERAPSET